MGKGEMQMAVDPADARAAVVIDLLNSMVRHAPTRQSHDLLAVS